MLGLGQIHAKAYPCPQSTLSHPHLAKIPLHHWPHPWSPWNRHRENPDGASVKHWIPCQICAHPRAIRIPYIECDLTQLRAAQQELQTQLTHEESESERKALTRRIEQLQEEIDTQSARASYSLTFLKSLGKASPLLEEHEPMHFPLRTAHPFKVEADFPPLGTAHFDFYLAPRDERAEFDEDDMEEF